MFKEIYDLFGNWKERYKGSSLSLNLISAIVKKEGNEQDFSEWITGHDDIIGHVDLYNIKNMGLEDVIHTLNKVCVYQQREINNLKSAISGLAFECHEKSKNNGIVDHEEIYDILSRSEVNNG